MILGDSFCFQDSEHPLGQSLSSIRRPGADVSHSSPGLVRPSIAAVVGTFDMEFCRYADATSLQNPRQETISDLRAMVGVSTLHRHYVLILC